VIGYIPADRKSLVFLHHNRLTPGNIDLQPERWRMLQEVDAQRLDAVESYLTTGDVCRSRQLLAYFGQTETRDCGSCDVCRSHTPEQRTRTLLKRYAEEHPGSSTEELKAWCSNPANGLPQNALALYRKMLDEGEL
jgi:ATP-dependent DNA helicase RecQ